MNKVSEIKYLYFILTSASTTLTIVMKSLMYVYRFSQRGVKMLAQNPDAKLQNIKSSIVF